MTKFQKELISTAIYFLVVLALTAFVIKYVGQRTVVEGPSMNDTLENGDNLWVNKLGYHFGDPERFDIVVLKVNYEPGTYYIKRVIGLPGETVRIDEEGVIYINGEVLEEHYGKETIDTAHIGRAINEVKLGEGEFFVMGDNRNNSLDSRFEAVGNIKKSDIIGKAVLRMYPFNKFGKVGK
jgi:signal peptidase I